MNVIEIAIDGGRHSGGYVARVLRAPGPGEPSAPFILDVDEILSQRSVIESVAIASSVPSRGVGSAAEQPFRRVGTQLFDALFTEQIETVYRTSLSVTQQRGEKLQILLRLGANPELAALPWELLFDRATENYVCIRGPVIRHIPAATPAPLPLVPPLRILGVVASPLDLPSLDVATERERLETALASLLSEGRIKLNWLAEATWAGVQRELLASQWHVLHFIGHGGYDIRKSEGLIALVGANGRADHIEATRLCDLLSLAQPTPRLVVLNCCSSGANGRADIFSGTATQLVKNGVSAVAAMQFAISDNGGISFARGFYESIATFHSVSDAMTSGRIAIRGTNSLEWATPVLWLSGDPDQHLFLSAPRDGRAEAEYSRGQTALARHDWPTAVREFTAVMDIDPNHPGAADCLATAKQHHLDQLYARAVLAIKDADWATAIRDLTAITTIDHNYSDAASKLANAQRQGRQVQVANVPARNPHFCGRAQLLEQLHDQLLAGGDGLIVQAMHGLGGVGKTQLAIEYAHRYTADYDLVWWIDAEQPVLIAGQLLGLVNPLGLLTDAVPADVAVQRVLTELGSRPRWLLIFDNAEHPTDIAHYRPRGSGHVLVTSRYPGWGALGGRIEIDVLDRSDTVTLLRARIPAMTVEVADNLAAELGDLPLAAAQAAGYLEQSGLPPSDYLRRLRSQRAELLAYGDVLDYQGRVDTTWEISLERLRAASPAAVALLNVSAFMAPEPIPLSLFTEHPGLLDEPLRTVATDPDSLDDVVGAMVGLSLAHRHKDGLQIHRLVQAVIRHHLPAVRHEEARAQVVALLTASDPGDPTDPTHLRAYRRLAPHIIAAGHWGDDDPALRQLMFALNISQGLQGGDIHAQRLMTEELRDRWQRKLGADHPDTLRVATSLIFSLWATGEHDEARTLGQDTLQRMRRVRGPDHLETLNVAATVTYALAGMGEPEEASTLGQDTLQRMRRVRGPDHLETLNVAATLTRALAGMGEVEQASQLSEDTLHRSRRTLGADAPATLRIASSTAVAMAIVGHEEQARALAQDTLQRAGRTLGPDHPLTLNLSIEMGFALVGTGVAENLGSADDTLQHTLQALGPGHRSARRAALYLEFVLTESTLPAHAREMAEDTWQRASRNLGRRHPNTQYMQAILALALARSGEYERASTLARGLQQDSSDRFDPVTLPATAALTIALIGLGQTERARAIANTIVQHALAELGENHPLTPWFTQRLTAIDVEPPRQVISGAASAEPN